LLNVSFVLIASGLAILVFNFRDDIFDNLRLLSYSTENQQSFLLLNKIAAALKLIRKELERFERLNAVINRNSNLIDLSLKKEILELDQDIDFVFSRLDTIKGSDSTIKARRKLLADEIDSYVKRVDILKNLLTN
jgi:hypothetical protein